MNRQTVKTLNARARRLAKAAAKGNANKIRAAERTLKAARLRLEDEAEALA